MLKEYVQHNYSYARFDNYSYHCCRETHFSSRLYIIFDSQWSVKCRSRALCHGVCLKSMSRTITMQGIILAAITAAEKFT